MKWMGKSMGFVSIGRVSLFFTPAYLAGLFFLYTYNQGMFQTQIYKYVPVTLALIALIKVLKSFRERKNVLMSWLLVWMNHLWIALALSFN